LGENWSYKGEGGLKEGRTSIKIRDEKVDTSKREGPRDERKTGESGGWGFPLKIKDVPIKRHKRTVAEDNADQRPKVPRERREWNGGTLRTYREKC